MSPMELLQQGERERLFGSREREGKLKIIFPFYGKFEACIPGNHGKQREFSLTPVLQAPLEL